MGPRRYKPILEQSFLFFCHFPRCKNYKCLRDTIRKTDFLGDILGAIGETGHEGGSGSSKVKSRLMQYSERYEFKEPDEKERAEDGVLIIPVTEHGYADGKMRIVDHFAGEKATEFCGR